MADPNFHADRPHPGIDSNRAAANHAFIDGGAAFAVFFSQLGQQAASLSNLDMDLIINGSYYPQEWDKWINGKGDNRSHWTIRLSVPDVLMQSAEILQTQVRLFSVQEARRWAVGRGKFRWAFIDNRGVTADHDGIDSMHPWGAPFNETPQMWPYSEKGGQPQTCGAWKKIDQKKYDPMEFFPTYMRCILAYGMARGVDPAHRWNLVQPATNLSGSAFR